MFARLFFNLSLVSMVSLASPVHAGDEDAIQIFVSKDLQSLVVYEGGTPIATSKVSTGKPGHTTPSGIFSVLEKRKSHFSRKYDNAPMPWMQRLTWSGIALHESSSVPDYPASHGCIRMPRDFAKSLYSITKRGYHVVISDRPVVPQAIVHENLFSPRIAIPAEFLSDAEMRPTASLKAGSELALAEVPPKAGAVAIAALPKPQEAVRMLVTRAPQSVAVADAQSILNQLGYDTGGVTGIVGRKTRAAISAFQALHGHEVTGTFNGKLTTALYRMVNRAPPANGRIFVRRNFKPVYDAAVEIASPEISLGTHFLVASRVNAAQRSAEWHAVSLDNPLGDKTRARLGITAESDPLAPDSASAALDRLVIAPDVRVEIEKMLGNGSSLTISDIWSPDETGLGTDFITILNRPASRPEDG
jgi:peptidoglycan hydrolase-like protein with peptidoglycan-binding domain